MGAGDSAQVHEEVQFCPMLTTRRFGNPFRLWSHACYQWPDSSANKLQVLANDDSKIPPGQPECEYGRWGTLGRAVRDAQLLTVSNFYGQLVVLISTVAMTAVFATTITVHGAGLKALVSVCGTLVGLAAGLLALTTYAFSFVGRRRHWVHQFHYFTMGGPYAGSGFSLESRHWHTYRELQCVISIPGSRTPLVLPSDTAWMGYISVFGAHPAEFLHSWSVSSVVGDPPAPGTYRYVWRCKSADGRKLVLARVRHRVIEGQTDAPIKEQSGRSEP